ncbi:MAG TPA: hypothetical protein EYP19_16720, partial [Desulfobacterales bacterium]|nr:hypothetical protein [Desulfobacterales bacterium]
MAEQEGTDGLSRLISYSLLYATLGSLATNVTPEVLRVLAELGEVERAVDYAEMIVEPAQRAKAFQAIGGGGLLAALLHEMQTEKPKLDRAFLKRALEEAQRITDVEEKAKFLYILAPELARAGEAEASLVAAEQIDKEWPDEFHRRKLEVLARIPVELARAGKAKEALAALERVDEKYHSKSAVLGKIAVSLTEAGKIVDALEIAMAVQGDKDDENDVLKMIAWGCHVNEEALRAAVEDAIGITDAQERARALAMIAEAVKDVERRVEAEHEKYKSSVALEEKAANLIWLGRYDEALQILKEVKFVDLHRGRIVEEFIEGLLISDRFEDAIEMAGKAFCLRSSIHDKIEQWATRWAILRDLIVEGHT